MHSFTICEADQRSDAWRLARVGRLTGSRAADMLATIKTGEAAARRDLRAQLVCERLTGQPQEDGYVNAVMQRGIDLEPDAVAAYELASEHVVLTSGFLAHTELQVGCSLDGHVGDFDGIVELKCPKSATHLRYWKSGGVPAEHRPQILHNLWVTGAKWADFASFDPRFPDHLRLFRARLMRTPDLEIELLAYEKCARKFLDEVDAEYQDVLKLVMVAA